MKACLVFDAEKCDFISSQSGIAEINVKDVNKTKQIEGVYCFLVVLVTLYLTEDIAEF